MILPLRHRHRLMVLALSVLVPAGFAFGLAARKSVPIFSPKEGETDSLSRFGAVQWTRLDLWTNGLVTTLLAEKENPSSAALQLWTSRQIVRPDVIVYWLPSVRTIKDRLPEESVLLGAFRQGTPTLLQLPANFPRAEGVLVLYSLADQEIVALSKPFAINSTPASSN